MKKFLSIILIAILLFSCVACSGSSGDGEVDIITNSNNVYEDTNNGDRFTYEVNDKGGYDIVGFSSKNSKPHKVVIPASILGVEVSGIADRAFIANTAISEVEIPDGVVSVGTDAFYGCVYLTSVKMADSVTEIGTGAFGSCPVLKSVELSAAIKVIPEFAFRGCTAITNISLPASLEKIERGAFFACTSLAEIAVPAGVTEIGDCAFYGNLALVKATVPASVETFGQVVFNGTAQSFVLIGEEGSAAQTYAQDNEYAFEAAE